MTLVSLQVIVKHNDNNAKSVPVRRLTIKTALTIVGCKPPS